MKRTMYLKKLVQLIWYANLMSIPIFIWVVLELADITHFTENKKWLTLNTDEFSTLSQKAYFFIDVLHFILGTIALFHFRKVIRWFVKDAYFDHQIANSCDKIGTILWVAAPLEAIQSFVLPAIFDSKLEVSFGFTPFIFIVGSAMFFKVLAEIFRRGTELQHENEHTI